MSSIKRIIMLRKINQTISSKTYLGKRFEGTVMKKIKTKRGRSNRSKVYPKTTRPTITYKNMSEEETYLRIKAYSVILSLLSQIKPQ